MSIQEIKDRLPMLDILMHYNILVQPNKMLRCPFHDDQKASMKLYQETGTVYCFAGGCDTDYLDVIDFIKKMDNSSKHEAILKAKNMVDGSTVIEPIRSQVTKKAIEKIPNASPILAQVFAYFQKSIRHPQAKRGKNYLEKRGLSTQIDIGYNSGKWHYNQAPDIIEQGLAIGLLRPKAEGYQIWGNACLIFPLRHKTGEIVGLYGRSTYPDANSRHFYLKGQKGLYPAHPPSETTHLILTEAVIDAASLLHIKLPKNWAVLSLYGVENLKPAYQQAIAACPKLEEIIFALDADEAGQKAIEKHYLNLKKQSPKLRFSQLEIAKGEDVNSLYVNHLDQAQDLFDDLFKNRKSLDKMALNGEKLAIEKAPKITTQKELKIKGKLDCSNEELLIFRLPDLLIMLLGGLRLQGLDRMKVTLKIQETSSGNGRQLRHTLDLYNDDLVEKLVKKAAERLGLSHSFLRSALDGLINELEAWRLDQLQDQKGGKNQAKQLNPLEINAAKNFLTAPDLMHRTSDLIGKSGVIGEQLNRLIMFLIFTSRKMQNPLHVISFGSSGSGKTHLQSAVAALMPEEDKIETTALSDNAIYYFGEQELEHQLIIVEDLDGAENALFSFRELQTKKVLRKTITIKDEKGQLKTVTLTVRGPICLSACTTRERIYEDNANRSFLLYVDESKAQDERIMNFQRKLSANKINDLAQQKICLAFQNQQRMLKAIKVVNPFADLIRLPQKVFKPRRSNSHLLAFIEAVTFYHQFQRPKKQESKSGELYIETTPEDIEWAFKLLAPVLLRKSDELSGACRNLLEQIKLFLQKNSQKTFYQKQIREALRINPANLKYYLSQLQRYHYIQKVGGQRYKNGYEYEVVNVMEYIDLQASIQDNFKEILSNIKNVAV